MSHWDFGSPADGQHDAPRPSWLAGTAYPDPAGATDDDAWPARDEQPPGGPRQAGDERPDGNGQAAPDDAWPDGAGEPGDDSWSADDSWLPGEEADGAAAAEEEGWPARDDWDGDDGAAPYPLTYERDDYAAGPRPAQPAPAPEPDRPASTPWEPWPPAPHPVAAAAAGTRVEDAETKLWASDDMEQPRGGQPGLAGLGRPDPAAADGWAAPDRGLPGEAADGWDGGSARRGRPRWLIPAGIAVAAAAVGAATVLLNSGHPASRDAGGLAAPPAKPRIAASKPAGAVPSASPSAAPLTLAQAQQVLAGYTAGNNSANAQRSGTLLATVETGSSFAIDAGLYQASQAAGSAPYPAFSAARATYYIPRNEPASGPRWFVVQVANAFAEAPQKVTSNEYLLFTQPAPGAPWQDTIEPYLLPGASVPQVATGAGGLATAVSPDAASDSVEPGQLPAATAASLDGTGQAVADPGNLADRADLKFWQGKVPAASVTDTHAAASGADGREFALQTADGGALVFYTDAAQLTITPSAGSTLRLTIPGFYSPAQAITRAGVTYLDQFAAYDPPAGAGTPRVVADYSAITGKDQPPP